MAMYQNNVFWEKSPFPGLLFMHISLDLCILYSGFFLHQRLIVDASGKLFFFVVFKGGEIVGLPADEN